MGSKPLVVVNFHIFLNAPRKLDRLKVFHSLYCVCVCVCAEGQVVYNPETTDILAVGSDVRASVWIVVFLSLGSWILLL